MFRKILIANRGEIAVRIARTARRLGIATVAVYSDADANAFHVRACDEAWHAGPAAATRSYLVGDRLIDIAKASGAEAIHPGYGFLSENAGFAEAVEQAGLVFIGPAAESIRAMGLKDAAKALMEQAGVPVVPGYHGERQDPAFLVQEADRIGYPVLLKAVAGGGGKGMRKVDTAEDFDAALEGARREALNAFGNDHVLIEKFIEKPRHIEVQVFGDGAGNAVHLFERDCSVQRRHQKVVEEAPGPAVSKAMRRELGEAAVRAARAINYRGAGTIEFIAPSGGDDFYFMEMNTRLQVEHPVTELVTGQDLVEWQFRVARGLGLPCGQDDLSLRGAAVEVRLYAENPAKGFLPATGVLTRFDLGDETEGVRIDSGVEEGDPVTPFYDPMIAKIMAFGQTRAQALGRLSRVLGIADVEGCVTNLDFLKRVVDHDEFRRGEFDTGFIASHEADLLGEVPLPPVVPVLAALYLSCPDGPQNPAHDPHSPFGSGKGWRLWSGSEQVHRIMVAGEIIPVHVFTAKDGSAEVSVEGQDPVRVLSCVRDGESLEVVFEDRRVAARVKDDGSILTLFANGERFQLARAPALDEAAEGAAAESGIKAPLPGKIMAVKIVAGDSVKKGDPLIILEAMKMEHTLTAPRYGTIESVSVEDGDQVEEGMVLALLADEG